MALRRSPHAYQSQCVLLTGGGFDFVKPTRIELIGVLIDPRYIRDVRTVQLETPIVL